MNESVWTMGTTSLGIGVFFALGLILVFLGPRRRAHQFLAIWVFAVAFSFILQQLGFNLAASGATNLQLLQLTRMYAILVVLEAMFSVYGVIHYLEIEGKKLYRAIMIFIALWATVNVFLLTIGIDESIWRNVPIEIGSSSANPYNLAAFLESGFPAVSAVVLSLGSMLIVVNGLMLVLFWQYPVPRTARVGAVVFLLTTLAASVDGLESAIIWLLMIGGILITHAVLTSSLFDPLRQTHASLSRSLAQEEQLGRELEKTVAAIEAQVAFRRQELQEALNREHDLALELAASLAQESELNQLRTQIIRNVSHEFRTPLTIIKSSADMLTRYQHRLSSAQRSKYRVEVASQVNYLDEMLKDLLFINRSNSNGIFAAAQQMCAAELIAQLEAHWQRSFGQKAEISFAKDTFSGVDLFTDPSLIKRIGDSLIINAIKFSPMGARLMIRFENERQLKISISDEGIGIPAGEEEAIFDLFQRGSNVGTARGLGLGLYSIRKMVEALGGSIDAVPNQPVGSTFILCLPLDISRAPEISRRPRRDQQLSNLQPN